MSTYPSDPNLPPPSDQIRINPIPYHTTQSPSGVKQTRIIGIPLFEFDLSYNILTPVEIRYLEAFFLAQEGPNLPFDYIDVLMGEPLGDPGSSSPSIDGAGQTGTELITKGWQISTVNLLTPGDVFIVQGDSKVYTVTQAVDSNLSGEATMVFQPALLISPSDSFAIAFSNVPFKCKFLASGLSIRTSSPHYHQVNVRFSEVI